MVLSMERWIGKVAIVTGASSGIGAAIVERLIEEGVNVVALARRLDRLEELAKTLEGKKGKIHVFQADVTKEEDVLKTFKWIRENVGPIHILINNAGMWKPGDNLSDGETEIWKQTLQVNVLALCMMTREAIKDMKANNVDGHIIHINSMGGHRIPNFTGLNVYCASKYAVTALAETLRLELNSQKSKIKITSLSPGAVFTELLHNYNNFNDVVPTLREEYRILDSDDIVDSIIYSLSTPPHVQIQELMIRPTCDST